MVTKSTNEEQLSRLDKQLAWKNIVLASTALQITTAEQEESLHVDKPSQKTKTVPKLSLAQQPSCSLSSLSARSALDEGQMGVDVNTRESRQEGTLTTHLIHWRTALSSLCSLTSLMLNSSS